MKMIAPIKSALRRTRRQPLAWFGTVMLALFVVAGVAAPWIAPRNPAAIDLEHRLEGPSATHFVGTDELGRDTLSRLVWGARLSLAVSANLLGTVLAGPKVPRVAGSRVLYRGGLAIGTSVAAVRVLHRYDFLISKE